MSSISVCVEKLRGRLISNIDITADHRKTVEIILKPKEYKYGVEMVSNFSETLVSTLLFCNSVSVFWVCSFVSQSF